jgi:hypothetical protein
MPDAEEVLDLIMYRPAAFLLVRVIHRLPVTPNRISILSMGAGLVSAACLAAGSGPALQAAAIWYFAANVLDCSDGQLARIQKSGTPLGRIVDGTADYVSSAAIFLGIGAGYAGADVLAWLLVVGAGMGSAIQSGMFDYVQSEFISVSRGEGSYLPKDREKYTKELERLESGGGNMFRRLMVKSYLSYLDRQAAIWRPDSSLRSGPAVQPDPAAYRAGRRRMVRLWSFLGPTTNRTLLIACALAGRIDLFLWAVVVPANAWLITCLMLDRRSIILNSAVNVNSAG